MFVSVLNGCSCKFYLQDLKLSQLVTYARDGELALDVDGQRVPILP